MSDGPSGAAQGEAVRTSGSPRRNPAPRQALARVRPLEPDDGPSWSGSPGAPSSPAAAPGGTEGRDLLIPGRRAVGAREGEADGATASRGARGRAVPSLADLMPPPAPSGRRVPGAAAKDSGRGHSAAGDGKGKTVELIIRIPKPLRKRLKARAAELGLTPEETVTQLLEVWVDG